MGILTENIDEIPVVRISDMTTDRVRITGAFPNRQPVWDEIRNDDVEIIIDRNKFINKYCAPCGLIVEMRCIDSERPYRAGVLVIEFFRRVKSGLKIPVLHIVFDVTNPVLMELIRENNKNP